MALTRRRETDGARDRGVGLPVDGAAITSIRRFDDLRTALKDAGLDIGDAVE